MKYYILALLTILLVGMPIYVNANCQPQTIILPDGSIVVMTICCFPGGACQIIR